MKQWNVYFFLNGSYNLKRIWVQWKYLSG